LYKLQRLNQVKYVQEDKDKQKLIAKGFKLVEEPKKKEKTVDEMTVEELKTYAEANKIDLGEAKLKAEILAIIKGSN
jgi:hypothetical protein